KAELFAQYARNKRIQLGRLKEEIEQNYPDYFQLKYTNQPLTIRQTRETLLDPQTALLEFSFGPERGFVFVISPTSATMIPLQIDSTLLQTLQAFKTELFQTEKFELDPAQAYLDFNRLAFALQEQLLGDALATLPTSIQHLIIVPDGPLNTLPFEVLNTEPVSKASTDFAQLPYLLKQYQIQYAYSARLLGKNREQQQRLAANINCLAFAPSYATSRPIAQRSLRANQIRSGITALAFTAEEIEAIHAQFSGTFESGAVATKAEFLQLAGQFGILHLAMHGEADFEQPKFGHLIFSNMGLAPEQNLLYNYEIAQLNLQAQLAVLSACETGIGKYEAGEGVFSLARSFMYAGVPSIIMSLWKVNDRSTSSLMPLFYQQLATGKNKALALQSAKLAFLETAEPEHRHPFYWSGFVAMGSAQALQMKKSQPIFYSLLAILLLSAGIAWNYRQRSLNKEN
ncbi:MAG: CHAT domain-containing protein, partial [Phaeodactylibacter sp.]|nr:CHAT domain-containing protein [Phaeodactylibacter sp.]